MVVKAVEMSYFSLQIEKYRESIRIDTINTIKLDFMFKKENLIWYIIVLIIFWFIVEPISASLALIAVIVYFIYNYKKSKQKKKNFHAESKEKREQRKIMLFEKYGEERAKKILNRELVLGMDKEQVKETMGRPYEVKKVVKKGLEEEEWYWEKYVYRNKTKFRKYAVIINNELIEFGDL